MATWEDGPEYAPLEPPADFTVPDVAPLSVAPPPEEPPAVPPERPQFGDPEQPVAPLATLVPEAGDHERDPHTPFDVDSDAMSEGGASGSAWGAAHWRPPSGPPAQQPGPWGPASAPALAPDQPMALQAAPAHQVAGMPAPGTPAWFGPGPTAPARTPNRTVGEVVPRAVFILLGASLLWFCAPFTYLLAFVLAARIQVARQKVLTAFGIVFGAALTIATVAALLNYGDLGSWYGNLASWSLVGSLLMVVLIIALVNGELRNPRGGPPNPYDGPPSYLPPQQ